MQEYYREIQSPRAQLDEIKKEYKIKYKSDKALKRSVVNADIKIASAPLIHDYIVEQTVSHEDEKIHYLKQGPTPHHNSGVAYRRKLDKPQYPYLTNNIAYLIAYIVFIVATISGLAVIEFDPETGGVIASFGGIGLVVTIVVQSTSCSYSPIDDHIDQHNTCVDNISSLNSNDKDYKRFVHFQNGKVIKKKMAQKYDEFYRIYILNSSSIESRKKDFSKPKPITSNNFKPLGGVYAWVVNGQTVYIGKANNIQRRMKEHSRKLISQTGPKKYKQGFDINHVYAQELAITNVSEEQTVMESYFYWKFDKPYLNSVVPMTLSKIQTTDKYREILSRLTE